MKTIYPINPSASFNEWCAYIRKEAVNAQISEDARIDIEANEFIKSIKYQLTHKQ